ncbi:t-SNARE coiled-coil-like proteiny domain-containing protein [Forsythia ovata]|uniref:t-SNARE coiled-coil-like proteiny domain-containing protein n=1 Tax=Forsythia ovata TaxID=205694 RepID=A0ABD1TRC1_9LAMI
MRFLFISCDLQSSGNFTSLINPTRPAKRICSTSCLDLHSDHQLPTLETLHPQVSPNPQHRPPKGGIKHEIGSGNPDEIQLRIDPMHADFDDEVTGLRNASKFDKSKMQSKMTLIKAQAGVKNNMRRLNKSIIREGSNHVMHVSKNSKIDISWDASAMGFSNN